MSAGIGVIGRWCECQGWGKWTVELYLGLGLVDGGVCAGIVVSGQ